MTSQPPSSLHVVLIDDEKSVAFALRLLLQAIGLRVSEFTNPLEALGFLEAATDVDVVLCDLRMPERNGIEVLREVKEKHPALPFLIMSAHAAEAEIAEAMAAGAATVLTKPFSPDEFQRAVQDCLLSASAVLASELREPDRED